MFLLSPQSKVFLARQVTDMRKSFRGLLALTEAVLRQDPVSGHLFVFVIGRCPYSLKGFSMKDVKELVKTAIRVQQAFVKLRNARWLVLLNST